MGIEACMEANWLFMLANAAVRSSPPYWPSLRGKHRMQVWGCGGTGPFVPLRSIGPDGIALISPYPVGFVPLAGF
jgi:hypothetical protein